MTTSSRQRLDALLRPRSIAVIGASSNPVRVGGRAARFLVEGGWHGRIMLVNPARDEILGLPCHPSVEALPETPDLAIVAVSAAQTREALLQLSARGVPAAVAYGAGFREAGDAGAALERELAAVVRETGITLLGPNSAGFRNTAESLHATFTTDIGLGLLPGSIAVVSQSGGLAGYFGSTVAKRRGIGHKWIVDTGNEIDIEMADVIAYLSEDPDVSVIGLITEGVNDGERLREALRVAAEANKPVVALKIGTSAAGAAAAYSHTGALAGTDGIYDAVFRQHGVYRARDEREFVEALAMYEVGATPRGKRVAVFSLSGGVATLLVDACEERGLEVPAIEPPADPEIAAMLPASRFENPLDLTGQIGAEPELLGRVLDHVASLPQIDVVILGFAYMMQDERIAGVFTPAVIRAARHSGKPMVIVGLVIESAEATLREAGILVETYPTDAVNAVAALTFGDDEASLAPAPTPFGSEPHASADPPGEVLTGAAAAARLDGIPFVATREVDSAEAAVAAAIAFGGAVVLKGEAPALVHKTELGLVRVGLRHPEEIRTAFAEVSAQVAPFGGTVHLEPMMRGVETVLGVRHDPTFGPVVMVGLGGIFVEVLKDVAFGLPPLDDAQARGMIESLRGYPVLTGARGREPAAVDDLVQALVRISEIATEPGAAIAELDINPFMVGESVGSSVAVDAVLIRSSGDAADRRDAVIEAIS